jgi:hypothetical protein
LHQNWRIKIIILDYSQVALANIFQFQSDLKKKGSSPEAVNIIRHAILTGIKFYKKKYGQQYGEMVIACDGRDYWRKDIFPYYKAGRKKTRDASDLDWKLIFDTISTIREELAANFPYRVVHLDRVEADDIIATMCKWTQTNGTIDRGMFEEKQPIMIISSDGDFKQLHKFDNVRQWSPIQKKMVQCDDPVAYLAEHIAKAGDDGIPNVLSRDDVLVTEGVRQTKMTSKRLADFVERGRDACQSEEERRNWDRNRSLIDLTQIPADIETNIVEAYINSKPVGDKMTIYNYLVKHRCRLLLDDIQEF